jgi:ligand-binding SRPBCC domain-containing protein
MAFFELVTEIKAPAERCFDLARDLDLHQRPLAHTREETVAGRTGGLIGPDEEVTFKGRHFGVWHEHTSRITQFDRPRHFRDSMVKGRFRSFEHDHFFEPARNVTIMKDVLEFSSSWGPFGWLVDRLVLKGYLRRLLSKRNQVIKLEAERMEQTSPMPRPPS